VTGVQTCALPISVAFDEVYLEAQKDYARYETIKKAKTNYPIEYTQVTISSTESVVISRISKLAEIVKKVKHKIKEKISLKVKIDWIEEVFKMQKLLVKKMRSRERTFSDASDNKCTTIHKTFNEIRREEDRKEAHRNKEINKEATLFYGPMGFLSFLEKIFLLPGNTKNTLDLFDEVKSYLETSRENLMNEASNDKHFQSVSQTRNPYLDSTAILKSSFESSLFSALIDTKPRYTQEHNPFIEFNTVDCCQFFIFCAHYYSKYQYSPLEISKVEY
jgi:hypothetical protein